MEYLPQTLFGWVLLWAAYALAMRLWRIHRQQKKAIVPDLRLELETAAKNTQMLREWVEDLTKENTALRAEAEQAKATASAWYQHSNDAEQRALAEASHSEVAHLRDSLGWAPQLSCDVDHAIAYSALMVMMKRAAARHAPYAEMDIASLAPHMDPQAFELVRTAAAEAEADVSFLSAELRSWCGRPYSLRGPTANLSGAAGTPPGNQPGPG